MRTGIATLLVAFVALACRPTHATESVHRAPTLPFPEPSAKIYEGGLAPGWQDYGWAPRELAKDQPASLDLSGNGGWIIAHPGLEGRYGGLRLRYRAPASFGEFIEIRVDSSQAQSFPRVMLDGAHQVTGADGWTDAFIPVSELDPKGFPFDRVIIRAQRSVSHDKVQLALVALTAPTGADLVAKPAATREVTVTLDCRAKGHAINPMIYGIAYDFMHDGSDHHQWQLGATARRWGGNPASRYNWKLGNAWNTASDWFFQNVNYSGAPDFTYRRFLDDDLKHGVATALTVPTLGWVAKDTHSPGFPVEKFGKQQKTAPEQDNAGNGMGANGKALDPGSPTLTSVPAPPEFIAEWVKTIRAQDHDGARSVQMYILDNEPALWNSTHRDVHPAPLGYDELWDRTLNYAKAIKQADPKAIIAGPAEWGWPGYQYSAADAAAGFMLAPDRLRHGNVPLLPWWLRKLREYREKNGVNLVDVLDVHFYPQGNGLGVGTGGGADTETAALRLRSTRALWDASYLDESWIKDRVQLLPRLQKWIDENNPGMGISIGEWNFGAESHISGGLAVAEALGRFGQAGITSAFYWTYPADGSPAFWAFRAFRNYDGQGAHFLDQSVVAHASDHATSVFASRDEHGQLVAVLLNLDPDSQANVKLELQGCAAPTSGRAFSYAGEAKGIQPATIDAAKLTSKLAPYSMNVVELKPAP